MLARADNSPAGRQGKPGPTEWLALAQPPAPLAQITASIGDEDEVDYSDDPDLTDFSELERQLAGTANEPTSGQPTQAREPVFPISSAPAAVGDNAVVTVPMAFLTTVTNTMNDLTTHLGTLQGSHSAQAQPAQGRTADPGPAIPSADHPPAGTATSLSQKTRKTYHTALRSYTTNVELNEHNSRPFPATVPLMCDWVVSLGGRVKPRIIKSYITGLRSLHVDMGLPIDSIFDHRRLQRIIQGARGFYGDAGTRERLAITRDVLLKILQCLPRWRTDTMQANLYAAFNLAFAGLASLPVRNTPIHWSLPAGTLPGVQLMLENFP
ncbi:hypothetical protein FN846DRAFT_914327 [Sphaerosporella brunnea]|uniref:Core-binding (CB) domain-containing protein n=1 Tax=Sphaerosporella brunnea TaxID=1250544 RepID=A0A5J5EDT2_9PEZI|nr:hypothetical protein FN846DRAFT_914327 [Sphaerosporella brunnea]